MKPEFKIGDGKIKADAPTPKKQVVPGKRNHKKLHDSGRPESKFNDISWYNKYPALFEDAATVGFNHIKGTQYQNALTGSNEDPSSTSYIFDPSVLVLRYITSPGVCLTADSGFEMQIRRLYLAMKRKYRGLNTYQVPDLAVTIFCIGEFYRFIARLERIYGIMNYFNATNRIMPSVVPVALRIDYQDVMANLANLRTGINALIARAHSLCLPMGLDVVNRWFLLESNIFKDSEGNRSSYIVFDDDDRFYSYQATFSDAGGAAVLSDVSTIVNNPDHWTVAELLQVGSDLLGLLLDDDDVTLQLGDIISYFTSESGATELMTLTSLPDDYMVVPVYNSDILLQVHNATTIGEAISTSTTSTLDPSQFNSGAFGTIGVYVNYSSYCGIWQYDNHIYFAPYLGNSNYTSNTLYFNQTGLTASDQLNLRAGNLILDTWVNKPSAADVMEMTRLTTMISTQYLVISSAYYHTLKVEACGTEMIMGYTVLNPGDQNSNDGYKLHTLFKYVNALTEIEACEITKFDWHPLMYFTQSWDSTTALGTHWVYRPHVFGDLDNAKVFTPDVLVRIHDAAIMSLFDITSLKGILPDKG